MQEQFSKYLVDESQPTRQRALTSNSYKNVFQKENKVSLSDEETNTELATYGDAILKLAFCKILFDEGIPNITVEKQKYEPDKVLIEKIAQHYELLKYIRFDKADPKIPQDYTYREPSQKGKESTSKYIATAVEALLAAFYLDNNENFDLIIESVKSWKMLIDDPE